MLAVFMHIYVKYLFRQNAILSVLLGILVFKFPIDKYLKLDRAADNSLRIATVLSSLSDSINKNSLFLILDNYQQHQLF